MRLLGSINPFFKKKKMELEGYIETSENGKKIGICGIGSYAVMQCSYFIREGYLYSDLTSIGYVGALDSNTDVIKDAEGVLTELERFKSHKKAILVKTPSYNTTFYRIKGMKGPSIGCQGDPYQGLQALKENGLSDLENLVEKLRGHERVTRSTDAEIFLRTLSGGHSPAEYAFGYLMSTRPKYLRIGLEPIPSKIGMNIENKKRQFALQLKYNLGHLDAIIMIDNREAKRVRPLIHQDLYAVRGIYGVLMARSFIRDSPDFGDVFRELRERGNGIIGISAQSIPVPKERSKIPPLISDNISYVFKETASQLMRCNPEKISQHFILVAGAISTKEYEEAIAMAGLPRNAEPLFSGMKLMDFDNPEVEVINIIDFWTVKGSIDAINSFYGLEEETNEILPSDVMENYAEEAEEIAEKVAHLLGVDLNELMGKTIF